MDAVYLVIIAALYAATRWLVALTYVAGFTPRSTARRITSIPSPGRRRMVSLSLAAVCSNRFAVAGATIPRRDREGCESRACASVDSDRPKR